MEGLKKRVVLFLHTTKGAEKASFWRFFLAKIRFLRHHKVLNFHKTGTSTTVQQGCNVFSVPVQVDLLFPKNLHRNVFLVVKENWPTIAQWVQWVLQASKSKNVNVCLDVVSLCTRGHSGAGFGDGHCVSE